MKPTQEQVIAWAREAGMAVGAGLLVKDVYGQSPSIEHIQAAMTLAYEAGRKDENEECAEIAAWILKMPENDVSAAIRARREQ